VQLTPGLHYPLKCGRFAGERGTTDEYMITSWNLKRDGGEIVAADPNHQVLDFSRPMTLGGDVCRVNPLGQHPDLTWANTAGSVWQIGEARRAKCDLCLEHRLHHS
jgi:hypothetical protein